jgi:transposase
LGWTSLTKNLFQVHGVDAQGRVLLRKRLARAQVLTFFANLPRCVIGLEACGGAHHWARELIRLGHDARLMPPQYVKAYVKTNKHDAADAEACCEALQRPSMRFVPVKSAIQQTTLMLHRVRDQLIGQRTASINALRGHLAELGIVATPRQAGLRQLLAVLGELEDGRMPPLARELLQLLVTQIRELDDKIAGLDRRLIALTRTDETCRMLVAVPGIGPVIATALTATVPDARAFGSGRHLAAWLGLVPGQHSSAGKQRRLGLSKRGEGLPAAPADPRRPGPGQSQSGTHGQTVVLDRRPAGAPPLQRRGRGGGQQAGPDPLGDAEPRRSLSGRLRPPTIRGDFHELRGRSSCDGRLGRTEAGRTRVGPRTSSSFA